MELILWTLLVSLIGVAFGSFINVIVFRTKTDDPFWKGRSKCRKCEIPVAAIDLIPVLSFFALKGRCRSCSETIEWQYPVVELVTGVLFGLLFARASLWIGVPDFVQASDWIALFIRDAVLAIFLVIIFVYDLRYSYILDRFSIPAIIVVLLFNIGLGADGIDLILGGLVLGGFFAVQFLISKGRWVGGGDIRMGLLMGFALGLVHGVVAMFIAYLAGATFGIIMIALKKAKASSQVPFGTFMAGATLITMIWGTYILEWYLSFFN